MQFSFLIKLFVATVFLGLSMIAVTTWFLRTGFSGLADISRRKAL